MAAAPSPSASCRPSGERPAARHAHRLAPLSRPLCCHPASPPRAVPHPHRRRGPSTWCATTSRSRRQHLRSNCTCASRRPSCATFTRRRSPQRQSCRGRNSRCCWGTGSGGDPVALFRQAVDERIAAADEDWRPARVSSRPAGRAAAPSSCSPRASRSMRRFWPVTSATTPRLRARRRRPAVDELRPPPRHRVWPLEYARPVYDTNGDGHLRIEAARPAAGPSVRDMTANARVFLPRADTRACAGRRAPDERRSPSARRGAISTKLPGAA